MKNCILIFAVTITVALLRTVSGADEDQTGLELYKKLHQEKEAEQAFLKICGVDGVQMKKLRYSIKEATFKTCSFSFVRQASGTELGIAKLAMTYFLCGNGIYDGGIEAPADLPKETEHNGYVFIEESGKPMLLMEEIVTRMAIIDGDGSGQANVLVRWATWTDGERPPFLVIHDLTKPGFPAMINILLNPKSGIDRVSYGDPPTATKDGEVLSDPGPPQVKEPARKGRWLFVKRPGKKFSDIVIEEKKGDKFEEAAVFKFDPIERRWNGPAGSDDDFWKVGTDKHFRASITDLTSRLAVFKKYVAPAVPKHASDDERVVPKGKSVRDDDE